MGHGEVATSFECGQWVGPIIMSMRTTAELVSIGPSLTEERACQVFPMGQEAVVFTLLLQTKQLAQLQSGLPAPARRS